MMDIFIELDKKEEVLAKRYAKMYRMSLEETFKSALFKQIEEEYDIVVAEMAHNEVVKDSKANSHDEVIQSLLG